ncbi:hypothetical protein, conserved [Trypanosoma brucei brucei TREU927]|uniref:Uncharacterized protein n=1 Tax=Trypanosoma brucei brucei (strain 927/4 GUTat10.1) TaxID=185431 RepID=Q38DZ6_TRYB2|nr:hypothetical protein, conserved [Trypanosoma brucei brucei TREU927]EAN76974.1 hypothetical protein, conserved [Trypanosoma brucei brucei TREU927]
MLIFLSCFTSVPIPNICRALCVRRATIMASIGPKLSRRQKLHVHLKAVLQALPISILIVAEGRDMYYRATWEVTELPPGAFRTGDVIAICNRWYTLPTWGHKLYSVLSKVLLKSSWDDVGVIWVKEGVPHVFFSDFTGAHVLSLEKFIKDRMPRGIALRRLVVADADAGRKPNAAVASVFAEEVQKLEPHPWYLFSASMRYNREHKHYECVVDMCRQRCKIYQMIKSGASNSAINGQKEKLKEMEVMKQHLATFVEPDKTFRLFNGSLVASFLATFDLLDRSMPPPSRYVPQDFAHDLPFKCVAALEEPVVFFKN